MRLFRSLKSTHWVIWSSPLLLLVLVFTLTTSSSSTPRRHETSLDSTTTGPTTSTTTPVKVTSTTSPPTTTTTTTSLPPVSHVVYARTVPSATNVRHERSSSSGTASNVKSVANAPAESASSGVLTGQLTPSFAVADVPLVGPGTWNVATSAPTTLTLRCENQSVSVSTQLVIGAHEHCQLIITPVTRGSSLTWQLTPVD